jgi:hypothetical protein
MIARYGAESCMMRTTILLWMSLNVVYLPPRKVDRRGESRTMSFQERKKEFATNMINIGIQGPA